MKFVSLFVVLSVLSSVLSTTSILKFNVFMETGISLTPYRSMVQDSLCQCKASLFVDPQADAITYIQGSNDEESVCKLFKDLPRYTIGKFYPYSTNSIAIFKAEQPDCLCEIRHPATAGVIPGVWMTHGKSVFRFAIKSVVRVQMHLYTSNTKLEKDGYFFVNIADLSNKAYYVTYRKNNTDLLKHASGGAYPYILNGALFVNFWMIMYNGKISIIHDGNNNQATRIENEELTVPTVKYMKVTMDSTCVIQLPCYCKDPIYKSYNNKNMIIYRQMHNFKVFFVEAVEYCQIYNSKMFIPETPEDYQWMKDQLESLDEFTSMWFPANDTITSGTMTWIDGKSLTERDFADITGQTIPTPSSGAAYNCARITKITTATPATYSLTFDDCFTNTDTAICKSN